MSRLSLLIIVLGLALQFGMGHFIRKACRHLGWVEGPKIEQVQR